MSGDGTIVSAHGEGKLRLTNELRVNGAWWVPAYRLNLVSISMLCKDGYSIIFKDDMAKIFDPQNRAVARARCEDGLYFLDRPEQALTSATDEGTPIEFYHCLFGHVGERSLRSLLKQLKWPVSKRSMRFCEACARGKISEAKFKRRQEYAKRYLGRLHMDTAGPLEPALGGERYFTVVIDEATRYIVRAFALRHKSDISTEFLEYLRHLVTRHDGTLGIGFLRCDGAREFFAGGVAEFLKQHGVEVAITPRYVHGLNGLVERSIRTLKDLIRCQLLQARLTLRLWPYALQQARRIYNMIPRETLGGKSPYFMVHRKQPPVKNLFIFGSKAFGRVPPELRSGLQDKGEPLVYLGHSATNPIVYSFQTRRVECSRVRTVMVANGQFWEAEILAQHGLLRTNDDLLPAQEYPEYIPPLNPEPPSVSDVLHDTAERSTEHVVPPKPRVTRSRARRVSYAETPPEAIEALLGPDDSEEQLGIHQAIVDSLAEAQTEVLLDSLRTEAKLLDKEIHSAVFAASREALVSAAIDSYWKSDPAWPTAIPMDLSEALVSRREQAYLSNNLQLVEESKASPLEPPLPKHYYMASKYRCWREAMDEEIAQIQLNGTYVLCDLPPNRKALRSNWVYTIKRDNLGKLERYKARLTVDGTGQIDGIDFEATFAPVGTRVVLRMVIHLAIQSGWELEHWDFKTAFLNGYLKEVIYMRQPLGYQDGTSRVWRLVKALYGLKQSPREWYAALTAQLRTFELFPSAIEPCLWMGKGLIIYIYVDDLLVTGEVSSKTSLFRHLSAAFEVKNLGYPSKFLGLEFAQVEDDLWIGCKVMIMDLLTQYNMLECNGTSTPMVPDFVKTDHKNPSEALDKVRSKKYQSLVGSLLYISVSARPDLSLATSVLSQHLANPSLRHWRAAKRVLRYLRSTVDYGLIVRNVSRGTNDGFVGWFDGIASVTKPDIADISALTDADYAAATSRRSRTGYCLAWGPNIISWNSKKQSVVSLSTCEAELYALTDGAKETMYITRIATELLLGKAFEDHLDKPTAKLFCDNQSTIHVAKDKGRSPKVTKHIDVRKQWVAERVADQEFGISYVCSKENVADVFTKPLSEDQFVYFRRKLGVCSLKGRKSRSLKGSMETGQKRGRRAEETSKRHATRPRTEV